MKTLKVLGSRCVVKENPIEEKTKGGVILTSSQQERQYRGTVVSVGDGTWLESGTIKPMQVKVSDEVVFAKFAGTPIEHEGEVLIILNERDILAVITETD